MKMNPDDVAKYKKFFKYVSTSIPLVRDVPFIISALMKFSGNASEEKIKEVVLADRRCYPPYHSQKPSIGAPFQSFMACEPRQCLILSQPQFCPFAPQLSPSSDRREQETCGVTMTRRWNSVACFLLDLADVSLWERLCAVISVLDL